MKKPIIIIRDSCVDLKILKKFENKGLIKIYDIEGEGDTKKVKEKELPIMILDYTSLGKSLLAGEDCKFNEIKKIIGHQNIWDAIKLEAYLRNKKWVAYFVTEDKDFLNKRQELKAKLSANIITPDELREILINN